MEYKEINKFLPKQLNPILTSYILDELDLDNEENHDLAILSLREVSHILDGQEPKKYPTIKDVRIFINSLKFFPNSEESRLEYYVNQSSDYLFRKFLNRKFDDKLLYWLEKNDENMKESFQDLGLYKFENLHKVMITSRIKFHDNKTVQKINKIAIGKFHLLGKRNAETFLEIFWQAYDETNYVKILTSGLLSQEYIHIVAENFIGHKDRFAKNWIEAQKTLFSLITEDKLKEKFRQTFKL